MIKLNCDLGESFGAWKMGNDEEIMPLIKMANIACGFHAGDFNTLDKSIKLAKKYDVEIGSHVSYLDLQGFGRKEIKYSQSELINLIIYQLGAMNAFCKIYNTKISYVKPHGAMYNSMMANLNQFESILKAINKYDKNLKLMILSNLDYQKYENIANKYNIKLIYEVFADRNYTKDGFLVPRAYENALIHHENEVINRLKLLMKNSEIKTVENTFLKLKCDSLCVHGDNQNALKLVSKLNHELKNNPNFSL